MSLKVTTEPLENRQLAVRIEVDQERVEKELRKAARKAARDYRIPGFRKGKAPYSLVVQYVGLPSLYNEFVESLGEEVYRAAIEQEKLEPYAAAGMDVETLSPLIYKMTVPLDPKVELGDYRSLRVEEDSVTVDEAEVEEQLERYREQYAGWASVERASQYGDLMTIDVRSVIAPENGGEETVVLAEDDWDVTPDQENPMEPPGFDEALLGLRAGEEKEFVLGWPAEGQSIYAGKSATFRVTVKTVQAYAKPELDDSFAQLIGPDFTTIDELKDRIRNDRLSQRRTEAEGNFLDKALDALVAQASLDYPPVVVEDQLDVTMNEFVRQLQQYGIEDVDEYLQQIGQSRDQYRESMRAQAEVTARRNLVISELYKLEGIEVTDAEVEEQIRVTIGEDASFSSTAFAELMRSGAGRSVLESQIIQKKTLERLLAIVRGEELPEPAAARAEAASQVQDDEAAGDAPQPESPSAQGEAAAPAA